MTTEVALGWVVGGFALLIFGADLLVRFSSRLGLHFGLKPVIVGATIVAFGTSSPEFMISFLAGLKGEAGIAVGNVTGSNIANIGLVMGIAALMRPLPVTHRLINVEFLVAFLASGLLFLMAYDGAISRIDGAVLLAAFLGFMVWYVKQALDSREVPKEVDEAEAADRAEARPALWSLFALIGLGTLLAGSEGAVRGAIAIAENQGWEKGVVGATIVALGTSLPELATVITAALKRHNELAVGGVLGSNIFNALFVVGPTALANPLAVSTNEVETLLPIMLVITGVMWPLLRMGVSLGRRDGAFLLACYAGFLYLCLREGFGLG